MRESWTIDTLKQRIVDELKRQIQECENSAEEYFQEVGDEEAGNAKLHEAGILIKHLKWVESI